MQIVINIPVPRRRALATALLIVALGVPSIALASHVFDDVPDSHTFHNDISAIGLAGISVGCGGGDFCPDGTLTRAQETAFLHRGLGRVSGAFAQIGIDVEPGTLTTIAETTITSGVSGSAVAGANGFLLVNANVMLFESSPDTCSCLFTVRIYLQGGVEQGTQFIFLPNSPTFETGSASISLAIPVLSGEKTVSLRVNEYQGGETVSAYGSITALYVPFGSTGTDAK